jgi:hypothetical protein
MIRRWRASSRDGAALTPSVTPQADDRALRGQRPATVAKLRYSRRFEERRDVEEYCISEGWVKVPAGKTVDRKGRVLLIKLGGRVEVHYR